MNEYESKVFDIVVDESYLGLFIETALTTEQVNRAVVEEKWAGIDGDCIFLHVMEKTLAIVVESK